MLWYIDTDNSIVYAKTDDIYKILPKMFKQDLTLELTNWTDHFLKIR